MLIILFDFNTFFLDIHCLWHYLHFHNSAFNPQTVPRKTFNSNKCKWLFIYCIFGWLCKAFDIYFIYCLFLSFFCCLPSIDLHFIYYYLIKKITPNVEVFSHALLGARKTKALENILIFQSGMNSLSICNASIAMFSN